VYIAIMLGLMVEKVIFKFVLFAWAGLGASIGPTSILSLFWKKTSRNGVIAGLITGTLTVIIWKIIPALSSLIYELIPGFIFAWIITMLVSYLDNYIKNNRNLIKHKFKMSKEINLRLDKGN
jgi:Na+/proline symporter